MENRLTRNRWEEFVTGIGSKGSNIALKVTELEQLVEGSNAAQDGTPILQGCNLSVLD